MNPIERERRAFELFSEACDLEPNERAAMLEERCAGDDELRRLVDAMLEADASEAGIDDHGGAGLLARAIVQDEEPADHLPERIGAYRVVREIGHGGMGVVYEAEQDNPRRRVAIKVVRHGLSTRQVLRRFRLEAQVLGLLDHPGIAHIYEAGSAQINGATCPYLAMEYVEGDRLDAHLNAVPLSIDDRLELVARLCDAVQHAHQKGIIHRDLKPANILVRVDRSTLSGAADSGTIIDRIGQPKVLDFGIARATDADVQVTTMQTNVGQVVGTLAYMSPEQVEGRIDEIDTRTDVYALGVILYEVLSGKRPHDLHGKSIGEAARLIYEQEPRRLGAFDPALRGDVETIVAKALEKERERRYASAGDFAEDLRRHLRNEPVTAVPPSTMYQARKFAARNKVLVGGVGATFLALLVGLVATSSLLFEVSRQRDEAQLARERTERVAEFQGQLLRQLRPNEFGDELIEAVRREHERVLERGDLNEREMLEAREAFEADLAQLNETNVGRELLASSIGANAIETIESGFTDDPEVEGEIRVSVARMLERLGRHDEALVQMVKAVSLNRQVFGDASPTTISREISMAHLQFRTERLAEAESLLLDVAARSEQHLGPVSFQHIRALSQLGRVMRAQGRQDEAEETLREAVLLARRSGNEEALISVLNELGVQLLDDQKIDEALACFDEYLEISGTDQESPTYLEESVLNNIMVALFRSGRIEDAERYARESVRTLSELRGDTHHATIRARNNLGRVQFDLGRIDEALPHFEQAHEQSVALLPVGNDVREASATNLIDALLATGRPVEAESIARTLIAERQAADTPRAGLIAQTLEQLGLCLLAQERYEDAEHAFVECVELRSTIDPDHWLTHRARGYRGVALIGQGRVEEGEPLVVESAEAIERLREMIPANMLEREVDAARERVTALRRLQAAPG